MSIDKFKYTVIIKEINNTYNTNSFSLKNKFVFKIEYSS